MTFKNNRAPLLCYFKLCAAFRSHWWIQTGVTVRKRLIWVKFDNFESRATLKFDIWPCKTIGHLFYATSSFAHHFIPIGEIKFELQSVIAQFGSKSTLFEPCVLDILQINLKNNRVSLLCYFKLWEYFVPIGEFKLELQSVNAQFWSNSTIFRAVRPWNLMDDLEKQ